MKTYEFQVSSHSGPVNVVVALDDSGDFAGIEYVGYDPEYDQTVSALYGKESDVANLAEMIELDNSQKNSIVYGNIPSSETTRTILLLSMIAADRFKVITVISGRAYHGYVKRFSDDIMVQLILSLTRQKMILKAILNDDYMNFDAIVDVFNSLDKEHRYRFIDEVRVTRFRVSQIVQLVSNEDENSRRRMAHKMVRNIRGFLSKDDNNAVVRCIVELAETMKNDRNRANTVADILIHTAGKIKPSLAKRIGNILLEVDPDILRDIEGHIRLHWSVFEPAQQGKILSILR